ncbi:MAG: response regulator [Bacteroidetes bacterium]|nr:response regulator [Bacteroidota bacterium]
MSEEITILIAEDDDGHAKLIIKNIEASGIKNEIIRFSNGEEILNFLFDKTTGIEFKKDAPYVLLLDIRMPKIDGIEVLQKIKANEYLRKIPVIMLTTTDDPREIEKCHQIGCNNYITKPMDYSQFIEVIKKLGFFLKIIKVPSI